MPVKERPILISKPLIPPTMEGRKTMTRRIVMPQPILYRAFMGEGIPPRDMYRWDTPKASIQSVVADISSSFTGLKSYCPYGQIGDILWVRETWSPKYVKGCLDEFKIHYPLDCPWIYKADTPTAKTGYAAHAWKSPIFMPRSACRIRLMITDIRVERVQEITRADAAKEGMCFPEGSVLPSWCKCYRWPEENFEELWKVINGKWSWHDNPFVWVISFEKL